MSYIPTPSPLTVVRGGTGAATLTGYVKGAGTSTLTASATIPTGDITGLATVATSGSAADLTTGNLAVARLGGGTGASGTTFWRGDGTWATPSGGSMVYPGAGVAVSTGTAWGASLTLAAIATSGSASDLSAGTVPAARMPAHTGDVTSTAGSVALTIATAAVTLPKMANLAANSIMGNNTGSAATPIALTTAQTKSLLAIVAADVSGLATVATSGSAADLTGNLAVARLNSGTGATSSTFWRGDGAWASPTISLAGLGAKTYVDGTELMLIEIGGVQYQIPASAVLGSAFTMTQANYGLTNTTAIQKIFNGSTNGALTLVTGTYVFELMLHVTGMSGTSGNLGFDLKGAGTATVPSSTRSIIQTIGVDSSAPYAPLAQNGTWIPGSSGVAASAPIQTAGAGTILVTRIHGAFDVGGAGTIIPSLSLQTGVASAFVQAGSYFLCRRVAATATATVGNWS